MKDIKMKPKCLFCPQKEPCMVKDYDAQFNGHFIECEKKPTNHLSNPNLLEEKIRKVGEESLSVINLACKFMELSGEILTTLTLHQNQEVLKDLPEALTNLIYTWRKRWNT